MRCIFCQESVEQGYPPELPGNFMSQQWLQAGNCICNRCYEFLKEPRTRKTCWLIKGPEMQIDLLEPIEKPLETLLNPPDPPFRLYLTKAKRKHGWIRLIKNPAMSRGRFPVSFEESLIWVNLEEAKRMHVEAVNLRERGVRKVAREFHRILMDDGCLWLKWGERASSTGEVVTLIHREGFKEMLRIPVKTHGQYSRGAFWVMLMKKGEKSNLNNRKSYK
jgi:hypothetical protein